MKRFNAAQRDHALDILVNAFRDNAGTRWIVKKDHRQEERLRELCRFCLDVSDEKKGAFVTDDQKGVALLFDSRSRQRLVPFIRNYFLLGNNCIGWDRAWSMIQRERTIQSKRPADSHLYCWMLGVHNTGLATIKEIRDFIFKVSRDSNKAIVAETTSERALRLYQRYGFRVYHRWDVASERLTVWFIRRDPS